MFAAYFVSLFMAMVGRIASGLDTIKRGLHLDEEQSSARFCHVCGDPVTPCPGYCAACHAKLNK